MQACFGLFDCLCSRFHTLDDEGIFEEEASISAVGSSSRLLGEGYSVSDLPVGEDLRCAAPCPRQELPWVPQHVDGPVRLVTLLIDNGPRILQVLEVPSRLW